MCQKYLSLSVKAETAIMIALNLGGFTPYCFGVDLATNAITYDLHQH